MAIRTLGTTSTTALKAIGAWSQALSSADIAAMGMSITDDAAFGAILGGGSPGADAVLTTGATHTNTTLDTLVSTGGGPLSSIAVGMLVLAADIPPGTFVSAVGAGSTSVTLSQAATGSNAERVAFVPQYDNRPQLARDGRLWVPRRGWLNLWPGDIVAIDNTGAVIVVPGNSISYAGSQWNLV